MMFALAAVAFAQNTASIQGTATDPAGAVIVGAKVTVRGPLGIERVTLTNSIGYYEVPALPPGTYSVEIQMSGFQSARVQNLELEVSKNSVQNFSLKVAAGQETITVEATAPLIESTTMTVGQTIDQRTVQDIPLNGRHFVDLALLIPGTVTPPQNGFLTAPLRGQGSFAYNTAGNREDAINFMINGINLSDMVQNQVTFQPTINTVSEFKIDNSTYSAEFGRNSGSIVNIATRSGTNQLHGELYDFLRNDFFDARNAFNPSNIAMNPFKRNQFGADFGGPITKDKTYFFMSYEGLRQRQRLALTSNVFTAADRTAIQAGGQAIPNALLGLVPAPNATLGNSLVPNGFVGSGSANVDIDQGTVDLSHNFSDRDSLHGYYVYQTDLRQEPSQGTAIPGFGDTRQGHRQVLTLGESHVFNSNFVNEARVGANRIHILFNPINATSPASLGLSSTIGPNEQFMPEIFLLDKNSGAFFGDERNFPQGRGDTAVELADTLSMIHNRHSFKFGAEVRDVRNNNFNGDPGQLVFSNTTNFAAGILASATRTVGNVANRLNVGALDFFAQDSWRMNSKLTIEVGIRYAWNKTPTEAMNRFTALLPAAGTASTLVPITQPYGQNNANYQPRVGFAFNIFKDTVLRGGYGYQVDQPITGVVTGLTSNPPFALPISVASPPAPALPLTLATVGGSFTGNPANISPLVVNPNFKNADVQSYNLNLEQQVSRSLGVMVGYFGSKGTHLEIDQNINQFGTLGSPATKPFLSISPSSPTLPGVSLANNITERNSNGTSTYNALWVTANQRMSHNLQFNMSYTWSHSLDENSRNDQGVVVQDSTDIFGSVGPSDFDARHRFVVNAIYDLPFKGNRLTSGWSIAPILSFQSGNPFNIVVNTPSITGTATVRPNLIAPIQVTGSIGGWIANPLATFGAPGAGFGDLSRNAIVGPDFQNVDLAIYKNTKITERLNLQLRADAFDLLNHPNFGQPNNVIPWPIASQLQTLASPFTAANFPSSFGTITSTRFPTGDSGSSRQIQVALKLQF
jgi:hypothetical protein